MRMPRTLAKIEFIISKNRLLEALVCSIGAGNACLRTATALFNQKICRNWQNFAVKNLRCDRLPRIAPCTVPCFWFRLVARTLLDEDVNLEAGEVEEEGYGSVEAEQVLC